MPYIVTPYANDASPYLNGTNLTKSEAALKVAFDHVESSSIVRPNLGGNGNPPDSMNYSINESTHGGFYNEAAGRIVLSTVYFYSPRLVTEMGFWITLAQAGGNSGGALYRVNADFAANSVTNSLQLSFA